MRVLCHLCIYVCVRMYVCMFVCSYVCMCVDRHRSMYVCVYARIYVQIEGNILSARTGWRVAESKRKRGGSVLQYLSILLFCELDCSTAITTLFRDFIIPPACLAHAQHLSYSVLYAHKSLCYTFKSGYDAIHEIKFQLKRSLTASTSS
jgi:hypothetical protein